MRQELFYLPRGQDAQQEAIPGKGQNQGQVEPFGHAAVAMIVCEVVQVREDIERIRDKEQPGDEGEGPEESFQGGYPARRER